MIRDGGAFSRGAEYITPVETSRYTLFNICIILHAKIELFENSHIKSFKYA